MAFVVTLEKLLSSSVLTCFAVNNLKDLGQIHGCQKYFLYETTIPWINESSDRHTSYSGSEFSGIWDEERFSRIAPALWRDPCLVWSYPSNSLDDRPFCRIYPADRKRPLLESYVSENGRWSSPGYGISPENVLIGPEVKDRVFV
ncbi:hypothetical protein CDAR_122191 [Caerostris darwini]|uniref:Myotubularin phosphatase domain-containing protein n=1 Tax=Caerostris darwini TaxID=1538125 RepID=A0AAV4PWF0_9ARAC|nr:hypothetical protein CDAR_122191 [Caerostris darwini]